ncbi:MAG: sulfotransferase domain-containing protein [Alphaproteobacteria bacterium]|nr:sulfotransferase domain-containing protein [Alphaproteobacteria bacterium]
MAKTSHKYLAEASVWYLYSRSAVDRILKFNPEARFIVCLRNPVDMFASLHPQQVFSGLEGEKDIEKAWNLSDARKAGSFAGIKKIRGKGDPGHMAYQHSCLLGQQVEDLLAKVPRTHVMFLLIEDMRDAPEVVFSDICTFLEIENTASSTDFQVLNTARKPRSRKINKRLEWLERNRLLPKRWIEKMFKANMSTTGNPPLRPEFREIVRKHFRSDVELLQNLIGRDLSRWLDD